MLNFIRKRKKLSDTPSETVAEEDEGGINEMEEVKNTDEIEKNDEEINEDDIMNEEKEDEVRIKEAAAPENDNAIKEEENAEVRFMSLAQSFATERNIADSDLEAGINALREIRDGWQSGELTTDMLALVMRGLEYDKAVKEAREAGEIAGRNTQIEEKYMRPIESDGLPHLAGSNVRKNSARISSIFDLARNA